MTVDPDAHPSHGLKGDPLAEIDDILAAHCIDEAEIGRIGERYFRAKTSTGIVGTGIGLNLVNTLIEMHEGSFEVESVVGEGSTFMGRLPINGPAKAAHTDQEVEELLKEKV